MSQELRLLLLCLSAVVVVFLIIKTLRSWKLLAPSQKLFIVAAICSIVYSADGAREAYLMNMGWRWRLVPYMVSIFFYGAYIMEPTRAQQRYFTGRSWFRHHNDPPTADG